MPGPRNNGNGFTLVEMLVAVAIAGVVMAGIYSAYYSQQKSYIAQGEITKMQQNIRAAMYFMEREIRMAGCDPKGSAGAGITDLGWDAGLGRYTSISFTEDIDADGEIDGGNENIAYVLDGTNLRRNGHPIAQNIEALDFVYLGADGAPTAIINDIRSVQITLIARTDRGDPGYVNTETFQNQGGTSFAGYPKNDHFRRRHCTAQVKCRNLGL